MICIFTILQILKIVFKIFKKASDTPELFLLMAPIHLINSLTYSTQTT